MIFGIPHELKDHETRVGCGLVPHNVATLVAQGHTVYFQKGVMEPAGVPDEEFLRAGAKCVDTMEEVYEKSDFIAKFKDMTEGDMKMPFKRGQIIMTAFHMAEGTAKPEQVKALAEAGVTCISIETSRYPDGSRAMTRPMGEIAGRTAVLLGGQYLRASMEAAACLLFLLLVPVGLGCAFWRWPRRNVCGPGCRGHGC